MSILRIALSLVLVSLIGCGENDHYEISKDPTGRTVRLDKKTGQIAVIEGDEIKILKDPKILEKEKDTQKILAKPKYWDAVDVRNLNVKFVLKTSWRDGEMFYDLSLYHLDKTNAEWAVIAADTDEKRNKANAILAQNTIASVSAQLNSAARHEPFLIQLFDENMTKLREVQVTRLTRIVDNKDFTQSFEKESSIPLSAELYSQLKTFNVQWSGR